MERSPLSPLLPPATGSTSPTPGLSLHTSSTAYSIPATTGTNSLSIQSILNRRRSCLITARSSLAGYNDMNEQNAYTALGMIRGKSAALLDCNEMDLIQTLITKKMLTVSGIRAELQKLLLVVADGLPVIKNQVLRVSYKIWHISSPFAFKINAISI